MSKIANSLSTSLSDSILPPTPSESETEKALHNRIRALEEMVKERDILVGVVSHELRTPLTTIFGNAHLLLHRLDDLDAEARVLAISDIRSEAERLNRLVENMLLLARAGAQEPVPTEPVLVEKVLQEVAAVHRRLYDHRPLRVSVKPLGLIADGQPEYMKQVMLNLLSNAEKYSAGDEQIDIRARRNGSEIVISVVDRGPGVAAAEAEIIFQPFYRSEKTSTTVGGAGIGLAVCKLLVQAQAGRIWTRPSRHGGTVFAFTLPAVLISAIPVAP